MVLFDPFGFFGGGVAFDTENDIPDLSGKVIFVTGGNSGLGAETIRRLAPHNPAEIWLAARTKATADSTIASIKASVPGANIIHVELELGSFASIAAAVATFTAQSKHNRLDLLFLNAGIAFTPPALTESGYELQFGTNHMGHALLTKLLLPTLLATAAAPPADVRIVVLASNAHLWTPRGGLDFAALATPAPHLSSLARYAQSKLANMLFAARLARAYPALLSVALHPGTVNTPVVRAWTAAGVLARPVAFFTWLIGAPVAVGVRNQLWAACAPRDRVRPGAYYEPVGRLGYASRWAADEALEARLWEWTEQELARHGWAGWPDAAS